MAPCYTAALMASPGARYIVGVDLGTTHTVVAYADTAESFEEGGAPAIRPFDVEQLVAPGEIAARPLLPSARYHATPAELTEADRALPWHDDAEPFPVVVGQLALGLGAKVPGRLVASAKSWLSHSSVDRTAAILPWGAPAEVPKVSPLAASASYLRHVTHDWDRRFPHAPMHEQEVVLTVPASFDEAARALTLTAAREAGLPRVRLVEEPQAAFYHWLDRHRGELEEALAGVRLAVVVDCGGGTTDLTLIRVEMRESGPRLTRIAVGDHLMLGGDNMDLAIAKLAEDRLARGKQLGAARFSQLIQQCRAAKERLLDEDPPDEVKITVLGSGSRLVGGAVSTQITRAEVDALVLDGFLPVVGPDERPARRRTGIVEFGLPYVADPSVTRHVAEFLARNDELSREALGDRSPEPGRVAVADAVLFNGGVFRGALLRARVLEVLGAWRGEPLRLLANEVPELAVARGAVAYGLARRDMGLRIGGGSPRTYFLGLAREEGEARKGVCLLPRGSEEGEEIVLASRTFSLRLGQPVRFHLASSTSEVRHLRPGDVLELDGDLYKDLPPIAAVLEDDGRKDEIPVRLITALTEVGTLEMSCLAAEDEGKRWKLEFQLRGSGAEGLPAQKVGKLHRNFAEATDRVRLVYGKSKGSEEISHREVKTLRADLEKIIGGRDTWETPMLRELFGALFAGVKRRRRSKDHERVWFNLVGYSLRPGYGYPLDEWRVKQLATILDQGVQFMPEAQNWAEWWILWRRVAGGLEPGHQLKLLESIEWYLHPPTKRPRKRPAGPKKLGYDDMVRLAGSLEHLPPDRKTQVGDWLVARLVKHDENPQSWWAVGRLGARVPFYGSAHNVVPRKAAAAWLAVAMEQAWDDAGQAAFAAALLARSSGDRERDLPPPTREAVAARLEAAGSPESWVEMVREVVHLDAADERRIFGESLPPGLRLIDD